MGLSSDIVTKKTITFLCSTNKFLRHARASPPSPSRAKIVGDAIPCTRFNIPSRRAGPACPAEKCVPGGGTHGSRPTGAYPPKKQRGAPQGTPSPTGGAMWVSSPTERCRGVPYRRRSQDMLATARPPMRTVTAPSFSYRTLRISDGRDMCSPCRNTFSSPGFTSPRR